MNNSIETGKTTAIISYLTIIGAIIAIFMNIEKKNTFAAFHIRQALGIFVSFFLIGYFIGYFDSWMISSAFYVFYFILWIYGFLGALQGEMKLIPLLGEQFQKIFKNIE
ncbi:Chloroplast import component protein (Tic20) [compost metagenome]